jgi:hypothetical protein
VKYWRLQSVFVKIALYRIESFGMGINHIEIEHDFFAVDKISIRLQIRERAIFAI